MTPPPATMSHWSLFVCSDDTNVQLTAVCKTTRQKLYNLYESALIESKFKYGRYQEKPSLLKESNTGCNGIAVIVPNGSSCDSCSAFLLLRFSSS